MKKRFVFYIVLLFVCNINYAQNVGSNIFDNSKVHEIRIEFSQIDFWEKLINNYDNANGVNVPYLMGDVVIDGERVDSVGVRLKGYTSYLSSEVKKPIKIDFNRFVKGKKYNGLKKINLNNGTGDPSMQRDVICYDLLRNLGVKASRTSFSKVYINDKYWGLYQNIEQIDKTFLKNNFADGNGNLFKNMDWDTLQWRGNNHNNYHPPYELKTNEEKNDWSGFVHFVDVLNNSSDEIFADTIQKIFDVDLYLKTLAVDVATNNWDSYLQHGRNWYIYEDTTTGKFSWIPWDYNFSLDSKAFGEYDNCFVFADFNFRAKDSVTVAFKNRSFYGGDANWKWDFGDGMTSNEKNPLHKYENPGKYYVCLNAFVNDTCESVACREVDTNQKSEDCPVIVNGTCPHPANEIFEIVIYWFPECCDEWTDVCENVYIELYSSTGLTNNRGFKIDQKENWRVLINRLLNVPEFNDRYYGYFCNLLDNYFNEEYLFPLLDNNKLLIENEISQDSNFLFSYNSFIDDIGAGSDSVGLKYIIKYRIDSLSLELDSLFDCEVNNSILNPKDIVINEFVASNDSTSHISDASGKYEDWIEIFNNTEDEIDLSKVYLSDDISETKKWQFPSGSKIGSDSYLIVWADKDEEKTGIHTNFKLKKSGEQLVLSNEDGSIIDSLTFGEQTTNVAMARRPNGTGDFVFQDPTFGFNNNSVSVIDNDNNFNFVLKPNPVKDVLEVLLARDNYSVRIFSTTGQMVYSNNFTDSRLTIEVKNIKNGLYTLLLIGKNGKSMYKKFVVNHR